MITLVLGGARSGKSRHAQQLAVNHGLPVVYIATATASDTEMAARIAHHQQDRPAEWRLRESPLDLAQVLREEKHQAQTILVDCLTLWLNNHLFFRPEQDFRDLFKDLVTAIADARAHIIFVANEVGLGIIPMGEVTRQFVDEAGRLNQLLAQAADQVIFVAAGLPLSLKATTEDNSLNKENNEMTTQTITLLRHGQVDGEAALYGHTDVLLSDIGRINLQAALDNIHSKLPIDAIISSPLMRCADISSAFAERFGINYRMDAQFKEMHFGDWDGIAFDKLGHVWHELEAFFNSPHAIHPPAGETLSQFAQRIINAWEHLLENNTHRHLVLVCHGGVIRVIIAHLLSIDWGNANLFKQLQIDYASHSRIEVKKDFLPLIKYIGSH